MENCRNVEKFGRENVQSNVSQVKEIPTEFSTMRVSWFSSVNASWLSATMCNFKYSRAIVWLAFRDSWPWNEISKSRVPALSKVATNAAFSRRNSVIVRSMCNDYTRGGKYTRRVYVRVTDKAGERVVSRRRGARGVCLCELAYQLVISLG